MNEIFSNTILKGGLVLSIVAGLGMWFKSLLPVLWNIILRNISYNITVESKTMLYFVLNDWLSENHKDKFKNVLGKSVFKTDSKLEFQQSNFNTLFWIWYANRPVLITTSREKFEANYGGGEGSHIDSYNLRIFFSKGKLKKLFDELVTEYNSKLDNNVSLYTYKLNHENWIKVEELKSKTYDKIYNDEKIELYDDLNYFFNNKTFYEERGIPYKRGYMLYGAPGNGKTSTILALAKKLKRNVYNLNISSFMADDQLITAFRKLPSNSFLLIEDVDASTEGRDIANKLSFNTFLNILDGVLSKENICVFFTTNHIEKLDEAFLRCGRIDKKIKFEHPTYENVVGLLKLFYSTEEIPEFNYERKFSASDLQEIFISTEKLENAINKIKHGKNKGSVHFRQSFLESTL